MVSSKMFIFEKIHTVRQVVAWSSSRAECHGNAIWREDLGLEGPQEDPAERRLTLPSLRETMW